MNNEIKKIYDKLEYLQDHSNGLSEAEFRAVLSAMNSFDTFIGGNL